MKSKKLLMVGLLGAALFFSFMEKAPLTVSSIREDILKNLFTYYNEPLDSSVHFVDKDYYGEDHTYYADSICGYDISTFVWSIRHLSSEESKSQVVSLFGASITKSNLKVARGRYAGSGIWDGEITQYDPVGIQTAFNKLYQKPTASFKGIGLQKLYNLNAREYVRGTAAILIKIHTRKEVWDNQVKKYLKQVTTNPDFEMRNFAYDTHFRVFGEQELNADSNKQNQSTCSPHEMKLIGSLLRRAGDGTLPVLITCLKTVLKDYDPEYYNQNAVRF